MNVKTGNLIDGLFNGEVDIIAHCCNCQNNFGSGVAKEIKERIPSAYEGDCYAHEQMAGNLLGFYFVNHPDKHKVANIYAQEYYGTYGDHYKRTGRQLDYGALVVALTDFAEHCIEHEYTIVGFPYKFASDRAGGDWDVVQEIVEGIFSERGIDVIWYKLED